MKKHLFKKSESVVFELRPASTLPPSQLSEMETFLQTGAAESTVLPPSSVISQLEGFFPVGTG